MTPAPQTLARCSGHYKQENLEINKTHGGGVTCLELNLLEIRRQVAFHTVYNIAPSNPIARLQY